MRTVSNLLIIALAMLPHGSALAAGAEAVVEQTKQAVVVITGTRSDNGADVQSSGCCLTKDGHVLTTAHQIAGVEGLEARSFDGSKRTLEVVEVDKNREIALLLADRPFDHVVRLGDASALRSGADLISIAAPRNLDFSVVTGNVSSTNRTLREYPVIQAALRAAPGSSGGPVFDRNGLLVGLIIGKLRDEDWITAINPVNNAFPMLARYGLMQTLPLALEEATGELMPAKGVTGSEFRAVEAYNRGVRAQDLQEKIIAYRGAVEALPEFFFAWFNLGVACTAADDLPGAEMAYAKAYVLQPGSVDVQRNLGRLYLARKDLDKAAAAFSRALELAPQEAQSHNDLGEVYRQTNRMADAIRAFEMALKLNPDYALAHYNLGLAYTCTEDPPKAIQHFESYLRLTPEAEDVAQVQQWIARLKKPS